MYAHDQPCVQFVFDPQTASSIRLTVPTAGLLILDCQKVHRGPENEDTVFTKTSRAHLKIAKENKNTETEDVYFIMDNGCEALWETMMNNVEVFGSRMDDVIKLVRED